MALEISKLALLAEPLAAHPVRAARTSCASPARPAGPARAPLASPTRHVRGAAAAGTTAAALLLY